MKKITLTIILVCMMVFTACNTQNNVNSVKYQDYELEIPEYAKLTYSDSILTFTDYKHSNLSPNYQYEHLGDTVVNRIENIIYQDIEVFCDNLGGTGKIGSFYVRIFYHWKTKEAWVAIHNLTGVPELNDGQPNFVFYNWRFTLEEAIQQYGNTKKLI